MTEQDLDIARIYGASAFLIYTVLKIYPKSTVMQLTMTSGLNETTVRNSVKKLEEAGLISSRIIKVSLSNYGKEFQIQ